MHLFCKISFWSRKISFYLSIQHKDQHLLKIVPKYKFGLVESKVFDTVWVCCSINWHNPYCASSGPRGLAARFLRAWGVQISRAITSAILITSGSSHLVCDRSHLTALHSTWYWAWDLLMGISQSDWCCFLHEWHCLHQTFIDFLPQHDEKNLFLNCNQLSFELAPFTVISTNLPR